MTGEEPGTLMVLEMAPPAGRPYPPERVPDVLGQQITVDLVVGGKPFRTPGTVEDAELLGSGNLQLTIRLAGATLPGQPTSPPAREVLAKLAAANPGTCRCGHTSDVHGFGSGECWTCAWDNDRPDCDAFEVTR